MAYTTIDKPTDYVQAIGWSTAGTNSSGHLDTYTLTTNFGWIPDMFLHYNRGDAIHILAPFMHYNGSSGSQRSSIQTDYSNLGKCELADDAPSYETGATGYASAASTSAITFTHGNHGDAGGSSKGVHFKQTDGTFTGLAWRFTTATGGTSLTTTTAGDVDGVCCVGADTGMSLVTYNSNGNGVDETVAHGLTGYNPNLKWLIPVSRRGSSDNRYWISNNDGTDHDQSYRYSKGWGKSENFDDMNSGAMMWGITGGGGEPQEQYTQTTHTRLGHHNHGTRQSGVYAGENIIDYAFLWARNVQGFSQYGCFEGNGNADGPFVFCGFKPAIVFIDLVGPTSADKIGLMYDNIADWGNDINPVSYPREMGVGAASSSGQEIDYLSNGFKVRSSDEQVNKDATRYAYWAWAERPFIDSAGNPAPAH